MRKSSLSQEVEELRRRLMESQEALQAIRKGEVDAVVVEGPDGDHVYVLKGAEQPYRLFVETMNEGAVTLLRDGTIVYSNARFAQLLQMPLEVVIGASLFSLLAPDYQDRLRPLLEQALRESCTATVPMLPRGGTVVWAELSMCPVRLENDTGICLIASDITERKKTEELRAYLASIVDNTDDAIIGEDLDGTILSWNHGAERLYGYSAEEVIGHSISMLCPLDRADEPFAILQKIARGQSVERSETRRVCKDGTVLDVSLTVSAIRDLEGRIEGASAIARDITERKRGEAALQEAEARLSALLESTDDLIGYVDYNYRFVTFNRAMRDHLEHAYGIRVKPGMSPDQVLPLERAAPFPGLYQRALTQGAFRTEYTLLDGRSMELSFHPVVQGGRKTGVSLFAKDITARKRAEQALQESELAFRTLSDAMPQMVWICTPDGLNVYFNQRWVEYTGLSLEESYGRGWNTPFHPDDKQPAWEAWKRAIATGETYRIESRLRAADGSYRWFLLRGVPMRDAGGHIVKWFGTCTDIEDLKRAEGELRRLNQELDRRVQERTAELEAILDSAPAPIWIAHDPQCRQITGNAYADAVIMQVPRGGNISAGAGPEEAAVTYKMFQKGRDLRPEEMPIQVAAATGRPVIAADDSELVFSDGRRVSLMLSAAPLFDAHGKVRGVVATGGDVTSLRKAEQALRESEERLSVLVETAPAGIAIHDAEGRLVRLNGEGQKLLGVSGAAGQTLDDTAWQFLREDGSPLAVEEFPVSQVLARREPVMGMVLGIQRGRTEDPHWVLLNALPRFAPDGAVAEVMVVFMSIADRKEAEAALRKATRRFQTIVDHAPVAIFVKDRDGRFVFGNRTLEKYTGLPLERLLGKTDYDFSPKEDADRWRENDRKVLEGQRVELEETGTDRDGRPYVNLSMKFPLFGESGTPIEVCGISTDITTIKRAEEALRASEEKYRRLFESLEEIVTVYEVERDESGRIVERLREANPAFLRAVGVSSVDEIRGRTSSEIFGRSWHEAHLSAVEKTMETGEVQVQEVYQAESGRHYITSVVRLDADTFLRNAWDITAMKKAERAVRDSEEQFRILTQNLQSAVALIDETGALSIVNDAFRRMLGIPKEADILNINSRDWAQWQVFDERGVPLDVDEHPVRKAVRTLTPVQNQLVAMKPPSGSDLKWLLISAEPILDAQGKLYRLISTYYDITDRKQADEALRRSRERFWSLFNLAAAPLTYTNKDGKLEAYNQRFVQLFGYTAEDLPSLDCWWRLAYPDEAYRKQAMTTWSSDLKRAVEEGTTIPAREYSMTCKNGDVRTIEVLGAPMEGGFLASFFDVTDRKRAEEALRRSEEAIRQSRDELELRVRERTAELSAEITVRQQAEEAVKAERRRFSDVLDNLPAYVVLLSPDYHVPFANRYFRERFGEAKGRRCFEYLFGRCEPCETCESYTPMKTGEPHQWEWTGPDGRNYDIHDFPFTDVDGSKCVLEMGIDISERKKAEAALAASELRFRSLFESSGDAVYLIKDGVFVECNKMGLQLFAGPGQPVMGQGLAELSPPRQPDGRDSVEAAREKVDLALNSKEPIRFEWMCVRGDGTPIEIEVALARFDMEGETYITGITKDISERKKNEETLARQTAELARSNAELQQFAYVASHDLQEPLRAVASFTKLLSERYHDRLDADANEFIGFAVDGARRSQQLINDLLAYSRVGTRGKPFAPVDCETVLQNALADLALAIEDSAGHVTHDPLPVVDADETQLGQLFRNLVGNALKFHGAEPPRVHLSAQRRGNEWCFQVRDNGIGIDPRYAEEIFKVFQRLHTSAEYPGTGIGLAIAKKIVERHGGRIWVESEPGKGATFYFTIAVKRGSDNGK